MYFSPILNKPEFNDKLVIAPFEFVFAPNLALIKLMGVFSIIFSIIFIANYIFYRGAYYHYFFTYCTNLDGGSSDPLDRNQTNAYINFNYFNWFGGPIICPKLFLFYWFSFFNGLTGLSYLSDLISKDPTQNFIFYLIGLTRDYIDQFIFYLTHDLSSLICDLKIPFLCYVYDNFIYYITTSRLNLSNSLYLLLIILAMFSITVALLASIAARRYLEIAYELENKREAKNKNRYRAPEALRK